MNSDDILGYCACLTAILFFGTNFIPVKKFDAKDGMYFQWFMCLGIFLVGCIEQAVRGFPPLQPFGMVGGALWCTGNIMAVPTIQCIGMSLGLLIWGGTNMCMGWATGRFGLFGLNVDSIENGTLNYIGVGVGVFALSLYMFITPNEKGDEKARLSSRTGRPLLGNDYESTLENIISEPEAVDPNSECWVYKLNPKLRRVVGFLMAIVMGLFFGISFAPSQWIMDVSGEFDDDSHEGGKGKADPLDFVFSHMTGIFIASTVYYGFYVYSCGGLEKCARIPEVRIPAIISGCMWAIAQISWFVANGKLSFSVSFPLICSGPGFVGAMVGVFAFKEIVGKKNFLVLGAAFFITVASNLLIVFSKGN